MKRIFAVLIATLICGVAARATDVKIQAVIATGPEDEPATTFAPDTPKLFALVETEGLKKGDKLSGVWIAEDVGDAAPKETQIDERTLTADGENTDWSFSLTKPTKGWPVGKYRVEIYAGDELAMTVKFTIEAGETGKAGEKTSNG